MVNIIEGVESYDQLDLIKEMEVDFIQGYLYSNPLDINSFIKFCKKRNN